MLEVNAVTFKAGPTTAPGPTTIATSNVVVLVGPNNSGKSLALREIEQWCKREAKPFFVIEDVEMVLPASTAEARALLQPFEALPPPGQAAAPETFWVALPGVTAAGQHYQINERSMDKHFAGHPNVKPADIRSFVLPPYTIRLDGRTRFALAESKPAGKIQDTPQNHLWALFKDDAARASIRKLTHEAFNLYFVIDPTAMTQFQPRLSRLAPANAAQERALDDAACFFHSRAELLTDLSDGVQAFTGLVSAVESLPHRVVLIDEPEAFLHPPLARRLGRHLAATAVKRPATLVSATHSAEFLMGCLEGTDKTTVVRLTYENGAATVRALAPGQLTTIVRDPLLRSTRALQGLFHRGVIVAEADADRAFYDEINRRLQDDGRGIDDSLFVNAQNWQTTSRIAKPLRELGIPAALILDLDVVTEQSGWAAVYELIKVGPTDQARLEASRAQSEAYLRALGPTKPHKQAGLSMLGAAEKTAVQTFLGEMALYGVFILPCGELEAWLPSLGVTATKKAVWITDVFTALGDDPSAASYVKPAGDDVWAFIDRISAWIGDPARLGV